MAVHQESAFGDAIVAAMLANGWKSGAAADYRPALGLDTSQLFTFIGATQPAEWAQVLAFYGGDPDAAQAGFAKRVDQAISTDGVLAVLRKGVKDKGVRIQLAYFRPSYVESEAALEGYQLNRLTVVRELAYATRPADAGNRLDLTLFVNGIPVATAELKNPLTGQGVEQAKEQYRTARDPMELIFTRRVVANFAVDPYLVFVTTALRGPKTVFLPFNTGSAGPGQPGGWGNPPATGPGRYPTSYLWEQIWHPDTWLDLLERYVHQVSEKGADGRTRTSLIFPRYHQWHAVRTLTEHAARHGAGHNYLVMASAGSGKSNTIGWLAHRLASLHTTPAEQLDPAARAAGLASGVPVFDKILIITDRRNLDAQLRATVGSFEQTAGLVVKIDGSGGSKSAQLAGALSRSTGKIVTVTLHTFPALLDYLAANPTEIQGRTFAIIVDEAHSSQSGDAAGDVRRVLRDLGLDGDSDDPGATSAPAGASPTAAPAVGKSTVDDKLAASAAARQRAANLSYFAFTATPKHKTLNAFGTLDPVSGRYLPFHTYSMRQAIEEGFILDPLRNYVTYNTYWKLVNGNPDEREVDPNRANSLLARFALTHASTVAQHAEIITEHFRAHTQGRLGGRAKAMVVTASRRSAVQMFRAINRYIEDRGYGIGVLVAFSGTLDYEGEETSEVRENGGGISESALPGAFGYTRADDRRPHPTQREYRILVVAEKYQTGFDQPLLTTMYVNKRLTGIAAVQTLSRLNRTAQRKSQGDLVVLDFTNKAEDIRDAFLPFYEQAQTLPADPNLLYSAQSAVMAPDILIESQMRAFAEAFLAVPGGSAAAVGSAPAGSAPAGSVVSPGTGTGRRLHAALYQHLTPARDRFVALLAGGEDERRTAEDFRADLGDYVRRYGFLAQIVPYTDTDLECLYLYGRHLLYLLPRTNDGGVDIGEVDLSHLRVERTGPARDLGLAPDSDAQLLPGFGQGGGGARDPERGLLSELIMRFNERFGTAFTEQDLITPFSEAMAEAKVQLAAVANDEENFGHVFEPVFEAKMLEHFDTVADLGRQYFGQDKDFRSSLNRSARRAAYRMIRREHGVDDDVA